MPFIPHTDADIASMLQAIGVDTVEDLFDEVPEDLHYPRLQGVPEGLNEMEMGRLCREKAKRDARGLCFIGAGAYEHHIPAAVWEVASRGEFMTAYTPYQAEASQGTLQVIYEYQTMMASLMGMDVSNASLYDGASALAEAVLMAIRANKASKTKRILVPGTLHPHYREVLETIGHNQEIEIIELAYCTDTGKTVVESLQRYNDEDITAVVIPQTNFFGVVEDFDALTDWAHTHKAIAIAVANPFGLVLFKEPGAWGDKGADIVCGEGQPLGVPLASGGPYFGFMGCKQAIVRQMPGRIVGRTVDQEGKPGFTLTLQAREQHIRRGKATSNVCTNQGLMVTASTIYMSLMGAEGLQRVAERSYQNAHQLCESLSSISGVESVYTGTHFHEFVLRLSKPVNEVLEQLRKVKIQGGLALGAYYPDMKDCLLVCATETKLADDLKKFHDKLSVIMKENNYKKK